MRPGLADRAANGATATVPELEISALFGGGVNRSWKLVVYDNNIQSQECETFEESVLVPPEVKSSVPPSIASC